MRLNWQRWTPLVVGVALVALWEGLVRSRGTPLYILPAPSDVWATFGEHWATLLVDVAITGSEALLGFAIAVLFAGSSSVVFAHSRTLNDTLMPYLIALKAVPIIAVAPLLVIWLGNGFLGKAVMAAVICFFPIVVNLTRGLRDVPQEQLDLLHSLSATPSQVFYTIRVPNSIPFLFAALKIASTLSVVGAIVAEFSGASSGIGYVILVAALRIDTPLLFCGIALASLLGLGLYYLIEVIERRLVFWSGDHG